MYLYSYLLWFSKQILFIFMFVWFWKANIICIRIRLILKNKYYSYSYSVDFEKRILFVFVFGPKLLFVSSLMSTLYELFTFVVRGKHCTLQFHRHLILNQQCLMLSQRIEGGDKSILSILHCNTNTNRFKVHHQKEGDICAILSRHYLSL